MISIGREETCSILSLFGLKIRLTDWSAKHEPQLPYGLSDLVKERANSPYFARGVWMQHGWAIRILDNDLQQAKWLMLCWSRKFQEHWKTVSNVPCKVVGAPFVHYRRIHGIEISPNAHGTIAFPAHSVKEYKQLFDLDSYCSQLKSLPAPYQPVTVCLHPLDIKYYHLDKEYEHKGLNTVCAARSTNEPFYKSFYSLLRQHRFATSNTVGTHLFYAVEMGLPFFLLGEQPKSTDGFTKLLNGSIQFGFSSFKRSQALFSTLCDTISEEQREFVLSEMGMNDCLSPEELALELRRAAVKEYYIPEPGKRRLTLCKELLRHPRHLLQTLRFHKFVLASEKLLGHSTDMGNSAGQTKSCDPRPS